jgi:hypothetical protein
MEKTERNNLTPEQAAYDIAIGWINNCANSKTGDVGSEDSRPEVREEVRKHLRLLADKLLRESGIPVDHRTKPLRKKA